MVRTRGRGSRGAIGRGSSGRGIDDHSRHDSRGVFETHETGPSRTQMVEDVAGTASSSRLESNESSRLSLDMRPEIWIEKPGMTRFMPTDITGKIMKEVINRIPCFAPTWKEYPSEMKEILYTEFKARYRFRNPEDEVLGRSVWEATCRARYSDNMLNIKNEALKNNNTHDIAQIRDKPVRGFRIHIWNYFIDYWLSEKFQKKSASGKANRSALPEAAVHAEGSVSFGVTKARMEKEKGGPVSMRNVYERTHKKKITNNYVSHHAQEFMAKLDAGLERVYGDDPSQYPVFDREIWMEVAGPSKKKRVEGVGRSISIDLIDSCSATGATNASPSVMEPAPLQQSQYQELKDDISKISNAMTQVIEFMSRFGNFFMQQNPGGDGEDHDTRRLD